MLSKSFSRYLTLAVLSCSIWSCCFDNPIESYLEISPFLYSDQLDKIELEEGITHHEVELENGEIWQFGLSVPDITSEKIQLIIALSGDGPGRGEYIPYLECLAVPGLEDLGGIIFAPDNRAENSWDYDNATLVMSVINFALDNWPIDENKIIVTFF